MVQDTSKLRPSHGPPTWRHHSSTVPNVRGRFHGILIWTSRYHGHNAFCLNWILERNCNALAEVCDFWVLFVFVCNGICIHCSRSRSIWIQVRLRGWEAWHLDGHILISPNIIRRVKDPVVASGPEIRQLSHVIRPEDQVLEGLPAAKDTHIYLDVWAEKDKRRVLASAPLVAGKAGHHMWPVAHVWDACHAARIFWNCLTPPHLGFSEMKSRVRFHLVSAVTHFFTHIFTGTVWRSSSKTDGRGQRRRTEGRTERTTEGRTEEEDRGGGEGHLLHRLPGAGEGVLGATVRGFSVGTLEKEVKEKQK